MHVFYRMAKEEEAKLAREEEECLRVLEEERVLAKEEAMQQALLDRERDREAGELKRMVPHDVDVGEPFHTLWSLNDRDSRWGWRLLPE